MRRLQTPHPRVRPRLQHASPLGRSPVRYEPVGFKDFDAHAGVTGGLVERLLASVHHNAPSVYREFRVFVHAVRGYEFPTSAPASSARFPTRRCRELSASTSPTPRGTSHAWTHSASPGSATSWPIRRTT